MISLTWIVAQHKLFKMFVENRAVIRNIIPINIWYYVSTYENAADIIKSFNSIDLVNNSIKLVKVATLLKLQPYLVCWATLD